MELIMYHLVEVKTKKQEKAFLEVPSLLYSREEDENWVSPMISDTKAFFDSRKNLLLREGSFCRWLLYDVNKHLIGRIAAFYFDQNISEGHRVGYFGFFECADDKEGARHLFQAVVDWLSQKGIKAMEGPFSLGGPGFFTGSMVRGFYEPVYGVPYNFAFYNDLFLENGFETASTIGTCRIAFHDNDLRWEFIGKKALPFYGDLQYRMESFDRRKCEEFSKDFTEVFNKVWAGFPGMAPMTLKRAVNRCRMVRPFLLPDTILFVYYENQPVAFLITLPDIHQIIKKFKGKYHFFDKIYLWFMVRVLKKTTSLSGLIYGIAPEHRGKHLEDALLYSLYEVVKQRRLKMKDLKMSRIGDFAPEMKKAVQQLGAERYHQYVLYHLAFDRFNKVRKDKEKPGVV